MGPRQKASTSWASEIGAASNGILRLETSSGTSELKYRKGTVRPRGELEHTVVCEKLSHYPSQ